MLASCWVVPYTQIQAAGGSVPCPCVASVASVASVTQAPHAPFVYTKGSRPLPLIPPMMFPSPVPACLVPCTVSSAAGGHALPMRHSVASLTQAPSAPSCIQQGVAALSKSIGVGWRTRVWKGLKGYLEGDPKLASLTGGSVRLRRLRTPP